MSYTIQSSLQAVTRQGSPRTKTECDRGGQRWYARTVKESKNTSWMDNIAREVLEVGKTYMSVFDKSSLSVL